MVMSVLMNDAVALLNEEDRQLLSRGCLAELLYADDTLLLSVSPASLQRFLAAISETGAKYGLELHWGKFQLLQIRTADTVCRPDGSAINSKSEITYLGCTVSEDGRISGELARRLGIAGKEFNELQRVWKHSSLGRARKLHIFKSLVVSKLMYSLSTIWLNSSERRRLNGFQNRCLRQIWGIQPAFLPGSLTSRCCRPQVRRCSHLTLQDNSFYCLGKLPVLRMLPCCATLRFVTARCAQRATNTSAKLVDHV